MAMQDIVEQTVRGLGYDLVEIERSAGGLLRITIDFPWVQVADAVEQFITVEDCEKVNRQLQFAMEVDGIEYKRLEISSPGIDRPLRHTQDFERFVGREIKIRLKEPHNNNSSFKGKLLEVKDNDIIIKSKNVTLTFGYDNIKGANLILTDEMFKNILSQAK